MSDLLDGPAIAGPRYPSWNGPHPETPAGSTVELDDTPGARVPGIPTERLDESPEGMSVSRRRLRLLMAWGLFCSKHTGSMLFQGNTDGLRIWCWQQADKFISEADRPPTQPSACGSRSVDASVKLAEVDDAA